MPLDLIDDCIKGKLHAQERIYREYYGYGMSICLRYTSSKEEAVEVLNDSFLKVFDKISTYSKEQPFKAWLRRIFVNTSIDNHRKNKKHYYHEDVDTCHEESIDTDAIEELSAQDIMKLLLELPENQRITFNLYEIEGYSHKEIADQLGITESTSRSNLTRAKNKLKSLYQKYYSIAYARVS